MHRSWVLFVIVLIFSGFFLQHTYATPVVASKYSAQIKKCLKTPITERKSIQDFICRSDTTNPQEIAYQVVLDLELSKLDKEVEADLSSLQSSSTKDIGAVDALITEWFGSVAKTSGKYPNAYKKICNSTVLAETAKHFGSLTTDAGTPDYIAGQIRCNNLIERKITAYRASAWLLGRSAIVQSFAEDKHDYMRNIKDNYQKFLTKWTILVGQFSAIKDKWPTKTPRVQ